MVMVLAEKTGCDQDLPYRFSAIERWGRQAVVCDLTMLSSVIDASKCLFDL